MSDLGLGEMHPLIERLGIVLLTDGRAWSIGKRLEYVECCRRLAEILSMNPTGLSA